MDVQPIATIRTPYLEKFGIPRQAGLVEQAVGEICLHPAFDLPGVYDGLAGCSHLWLTFWFHHQTDKWKPKVRPPRLGGNQKVGIFATRSPRRPNPLGLSVVKIVEVTSHPNRLKVSGVDLLNGTPIIDIKPYLPYADCLPHAVFDLALHRPQTLPVVFSAQSEEQFDRFRLSKDLVANTLALDPRPAYHQDSRTYGTCFEQWNVRWEMVDRVIHVLDLSPLGEATES